MLVIVTCKDHIVCVVMFEISINVDVVRFVVLFLRDCHVLACLHIHVMRAICVDVLKHLFDVCSY